MTRPAGVALLAAAAALGGCGGEPGVELPVGSERVPGNALAAAFGPAVDRLPAVDVLAAAAGIEVRRDVAGFVYAVAPDLRSGWATLGASHPFAAAWSSRPDPSRSPDVWVYVDLQALVDHRLAGVDPRGVELAQLLDVRSFEWAIASVRLGESGPTEIDGLIRATRSETGLAAMLGGSPSPSLLAPVAAGELLRLELRVDPVIANRSVQNWIATEQQGGGLSVRSAMFDAFGSVWRTVAALFDGRATLVLDSERRVLFAAGIRDADDVRRRLDGLLRSGEDDEWLAPGGHLVRLDGTRLVVAPAGAPVPAAGTRVIDSALVAEIAFDGGPRGLVEVRRRDPDTLAFRARLD